LDPNEIEIIFDTLMNIRGDLPLKTYLGPVELHYDHAIDRMKVFQGQAPFFSESVRKLKGRDSGLPVMKPVNAAIYTWNKLLENNYNSGYAKIPRHIELKQYYKKKPSKIEYENNDVEWKNVLLLFKGWEKEIYALKMLEILGKPIGSNIEIEFENKWIEPTFLSHAFACPQFYAKNETQVLIAAAYRSGRTPKLVPLRWGTIFSLSTTDCRNEKHSLNITINLSEYAYDLRSRIPNNPRLAFFDFLTEFMGGNRIPFASDTSYFCQYVGIKLRKEPLEALTTPREASFKSTIIDLTRGDYVKAKKDVYYRIKKVKSAKNRSSDEFMPFDNGILCVKEGQTIELVFEACNPNLGNAGYPEVSQTQLKIKSTDADNINISPDTINFSKYGEQSVRVKFSRSGEYKGDLIFETGSPDVRIASFRIPFKVSLRR
jgi:hypothetical protein